MKKFHITILFLLCFTAAMAQDFEIVNVEYLDRSMQAVDNKVTEQGSQGRECALIRIATQNITQEQKDRFDFGTDMGSKVEKRANRDGEIWLWVTPGMRYLIIKGTTMGGSRELAFDDYGITIQSLKTYKIVLRGTVGDNGPKDTSPHQQYLLFRLAPPDATLEVNNQLWKVENDGTAKQYLDFGTYTYKVRAADYFTETGEVTVNDPVDTQIVTVTLKPNFATVTFSVDADAEIWVNDAMKGKRTWTGALGSGTYKVECRQANHETIVTTQKITPEINGRTIALPAPTPIYGSLNVESTPNLATIYIDGKEVGKTPKSIPQILIGQHELKLTMDGYADYKETITIAEGERKRMTATLSSGLKDEETFTVNGVSFTMKFVEGGTFQMGATSEQGGDAESDEKPVHSVTLSSYYIGETEVTQALWEAVMGSNDNPSCWTGDDLPVELVSWNRVQRFISELNQKTGKNFRLPTEAEWEYAARGGKKSRGYKYAGGNTIDRVAWFTGSGNKTHAVKTKSPNELGLYDMSGNVWEFCQDRYGDYSINSQTNPTGPSSGSYRVLRGGSYSSRASYCRVSSRDYFDFGSEVEDNGFRLALSQEDNGPVNSNTSQSSIQQSSSSAPEGAVNGVFSISPTEKVHFAKGNLQYQASTDTWRFAENQWDYVGTQIPDGISNVGGNVNGSDNSRISWDYSGWIDLFGWGTGDDPTKTSAIGREYYNFTDWGSKMSGGWRILTKDEWVYVFDKRSTSFGIRYAMAMVNGVKGVILLPDNWSNSTYLLSETNKFDANFSSNKISASEWSNTFAPAGAVFLPVAGYRGAFQVYHVGSNGDYWSASPDESSYYAYYVLFYGTGFLDAERSGSRDIGCSVRLVCPAN